MTRRRGRPLDELEMLQLAALLERALPPHHALYRTARGWYVYRWDEDKTRFVPILDGVGVGALLLKLAVPPLPPLAPGTILFT